MGSYRSCEYDINHGPWDPVTGGTLAVVDLFYDVFKGMGEIGSEFVRVPNIGLNKANLAKDEQARYPPHCLSPLAQTTRLSANARLRG